MMANGIGQLPLCSSSSTASKAFSRRVWLNKLPPRRCMRIYYYTNNGTHSANASVLSPWAHTRTIRYLRCISTNLSVPTARPNCSSHQVCADCGESVGTKLKHLIFTHLLEKHLCEISIYTTRTTAPTTTGKCRTAQHSRAQQSRAELYRAGLYRSKTRSYHARCGGFLL